MGWRDEEYMQELQDEIQKKIDSIKDPEKRLAYCQEQIKAVEDYQKRWWAAFDKILEDIKSKPVPVPQLSKTKTLNSSLTDL